MNSDELGQAMYEVSVILNNTEEELLKRIPSNIIQQIKKKSKPIKEFEIDNNKKLKDQNMNNIAKGIISLLYRDYLCDEVQRNIYMQYYETAKENQENEYNSASIFKKKEIQKRDENMALIPYEKEKVWSKIKRKFINFFSRKK